MSKLNYWLIYQTPKRKWRVWAEQTGELSLFIDPAFATEKGHTLTEQGKAISFAVILGEITDEVSLSPLTQLALPDSESWGTASP